jgi:hypothetical protein
VFTSAFCIVHSPFFPPRCEASSKHFVKSGLSMWQAALPFFGIGLPSVRSPRPVDDQHGDLIRVHVRFRAQGRMPPRMRGSSPWLLLGMVHPAATGCPVCSRRVRRPMGTHSIRRPTILVIYGVFPPLSAAWSAAAWRCDWASGSAPGYRNGLQRPRGSPVSASQVRTGGRRAPGAGVERATAPLRSRMGQGPRVICMTASIRCIPGYAA